MPKVHRWLSLVIIACLAMQLSTFVTGSKIWPFMAYCMYAYARTAPPRTTVVTASAVLADGGEVELSPEKVGLSFFAWNDHFLKPLGTRDDQSMVPEMLERAEHRLGKPVEAIALNVVIYRIEGEPQIISKEHRQRRYTLADDGSVKMTTMPTTHGIYEGAGHAE